jgi:hypothetical protein
MSRRERGSEMAIGIHKEGERQADREIKWYRGNLY